MTSFCTSSVNVLTLLRLSAAMVELCHDFIFLENDRPLAGQSAPSPLRKTKIYNTNLDLVTDNVYTNFGLILSIRSQDI